MRILTAAAVAAMLLAAAPAMAKPIVDGGVTAKEVADVLLAEGYRAEVTKDDVGDPMIISGAQGKTFNVFFYGCNKGERCAIYQFSAGFDIEKSPGLAKVNSWNRERRFGRVFLDDEDDPIIQMDVDAEKGHTTEAISNNLASWVAILGKFKTEFSL